MSEERRHICLGFTDELYPEGTHICYLYNDDEERRHILPPFVENGLAEQEAVDYFADVPSRTELAQVAANLHLGAATETGMRGLFELATALDAYCPNGQFVPDVMLDRLREIYVRRRQAGFSGSRVTGEMSWALRGIPGSERVVEYEARINDLVREVPITVLCQYDARKFDGATIFDVLNVHPIMIVRGHVLRNPFYVPLEQYMALKDVVPCRR